MPYLGSRLLHQQKLHAEYGDVLICAAPAPRQPYRAQDILTAGASPAREVRTSETHSPSHGTRTFVFTRATPTTLCRYCKLQGRSMHATSCAQLHLSFSTSCYMTPPPNLFRNAFSLLLPTYEEAPTGAQEPLERALANISSFFSFTLRYVAFKEDPAAMPAESLFSSATG